MEPEKPNCEAVCLSVCIHICLSRYFCHPEISENKTTILMIFGSKKLFSYDRKPFSLHPKHISMALVLDRTLPLNSQNIYINIELPKNQRFDIQPLDIKKFSLIPDISSIVNSMVCIEASEGQSQDNYNAEGLLSARAQVCFTHPAAIFLYITHVYIEKNNKPHFII